MSDQRVVPIWPREAGIDVWLHADQAWMTRVNGEERTCKIIEVEMVLESVRTLSWFLEGSPGPDPRRSSLWFVPGVGWTERGRDRLETFTHDDIFNMIWVCTQTIMACMPVVKREENP